MMTDMTRSRLIQVWLTGVALVIAAGIALGASVTIGTGAILAALCLLPAAILFKWWPDRQPQIVADMLHGRERRP